MTGGAHTTPEQVISGLREWFDDRFSHLSNLAAGLVSALALDEAGRIELSTAARRGMKSTAAKFLAEHPIVDGCGLIFAHSTLGTEVGRLEWWVREDESRFARYSFGVVPGADRYYDYEHHEWFVRAYAEGHSAAVGPYIDYLGVEAYIVTLTVPAVVDGRRVGAVGTDLQVDDIEHHLLPILGGCDAEIAVLTRHGTVLVSNSARYLPGELVTEPVPGARIEPLTEVADGMHVLVAERVAG
ncbi:MAG: PDC sensor domain-containing protein [Leucobacter sp.]|nr:PDC sensor domain-containing protein [Leucobacter sp.]